MYKPPLVPSIAISMVENLNLLEGLRSDLESEGKQRQMHGFPTPLAAVCSSQEQGKN